VRHADTALLVLVCAVGLAGCRDDDRHGGRAAPVRPVLSIVAEPEIGSAAAFAGTIEPRYSATLAFRVVGRVIARDVGVGDRVARGDRLAALDPVPYDLAVGNARAAVADAMARFANAEAAERRLRALLDENHASPQQYEAAQQGREAARAAVTQARSVLEQALEQRGHADLGAEFDGVVTAVAAEVNQVVTPGQPVITIARPDVREAVIDVPDTAAATLRVDSPFRVTSQIAPSERIAGRVREIAPRVDAPTRSRRVRIALDRPPADFRLGTMITAETPTRPTGRIRIPATALVEADGRARVWIVDSGAKTVALRDVEVAGRGDGTVEISGGLDVGDRVVTAGVHSLTQGQLVKIPEETSR
jgi:RND family efflux transporter MFP subunit